jgi:hypothetical protein
VQTDQTPAPTPVPEDPIKTILKAKYSQVLSFIPIGWADDNRSLYFVQVTGGLQGATLVGKYAPATLETIQKEATPTPDPAATPVPTPDPNASPTPSPTPNSRLVVELTDQPGADFSLSADAHKVVFSASGIVEGEFVNQVFIADLVAGTVTPIRPDGLPEGDRLGRVWHPGSSDRGRASVRGHAGGAVIVPLEPGPPQYLAQPASGFDIPRGWAPDGSYLAVTNWSGGDLANRGRATLELISSTGRRVEIARGPAYGTADAMVGWFVPS